MKKLLAFAVGAAMSMGAFAAPAISLPPGPIFLKFSGEEQIAAPGATTAKYTMANGQSVNEIDWGVFVITDMYVGKVNNPNDTISPFLTKEFFNPSAAGGQITGMFYGVQQGVVVPGENPFPGVGGYLDLYWRDTSAMAATDIANATPGVRTSYNTATGYTDGTFLARLYFDTGMDSSGINTIEGDTLPNSKGFQGHANSYASVDTTAGGLWASQLNSDWFNTPFGQRDLRFKNSYDYNPQWNGAPGVFGAQIDDPGQAFALPEPDALSLMGLAMAGMGVALRRRQKKAAK